MPVVYLCVVHAENKEKLLIVSQLGWPPEFGAQILRLSKIAKYLPNHNIDVLVVSPPAHKLSTKDFELINDVSKYGCKIRYIGIQLHPGLNKHYLSKFFKSFFIPDIKVYYLLYLRKIENIVLSEEISAIFTSTPPSGLLIGYFLKRKFGDKIKWIADFADPWTLNHFYFSPTPLHRKFDENMERKILTYADALTFASEFQMKRYIEKYPFIEDKSYWLPNGYDEEDFTGIAPIKFDKFTFIHMGSIYREFDLSFLDIFAELEKYYDFQLLFIGNIAPKKLIEISSKNLQSVKILGRLNHKDVIRYLLSANVLIFSLEYDFIYVMPSRLPEYLRSKKPILAFVSENSFSAEIIKRCNAGFVIDTDEFQKGYRIAESLIRGEIDMIPNAAEIEKFSWGIIAFNLVRILGGD